MAPLPEKKFHTGLVLGKFNPLTTGHQFLLDTAQAHCTTLYISVSGKPDEQIPQSLRAQWLRQLYPDAIVVENPQTLPYYPSECSSEDAFYTQWIPELQRVCGNRSPDALFTSESYGDITAKLLHCTHISVDPDRKQFPISATKVRQNPLAHWNFLPPIVRTHFVKTVCILGPESTGKTTLCKNLAAHFNTIWQPEWARAYLGHRHCTYDDMEIIAKGHAKAHAAHRQRAHKILIQDTSALTTKIFSEYYYHKCPTVVLHLANQSAFNTSLFLITNTDVPWIPDTSRDLGHPALRQQMLQAHFNELHIRHLSYTFIQGLWPTRVETAIQAIGTLL